MKKFIQKMKDPAQRKLFYAIIGGKFLGIAVCFLLMMGISAYLSSSSKVHAQDVYKRQGGN